MASFALFVASTPRHLYQAVALAYSLNGPSALVYFGLDNNSPLVKQAVSDGPFTNTFALEQPSLSADRRRVFKQHQSQIDQLCEQLDPDVVYVGNDIQPISQYCLYRAKSTNVDCQGAYVDEGTGSYMTGRSALSIWGKQLEGWVKRLQYGRWYKRPTQLGHSIYIDQQLLEFGSLANGAGVQLNMAIFEAPAFAEFAQRVADAAGDQTQLSTVDALLIVPHSIVFDRLYGGTQVLTVLAQSLIDLGIHLAIKTHPRDQVRFAVNGAPTYIANQLPAELILPLLPPSAVVIGDVSSAILSANRMLGRDRVFSLAVNDGEFASQAQSLLRQLDAQILSPEQVVIELGKLFATQV